MKKMFLFAAMACVALASCTKNEPVNVPQEDAITFAAPVVGLNTKAVEIKTDYPTDVNFSVFAHYFTGNYSTLTDGKLYMNDVETAYDATLVAWNSATNYYWPKQGTLTFAAYSPSSVAAEYDVTGLKFNDFVVPATAAEQYDLLFSERAYNQTKDEMTTAEDPYKGVQIKFNHALSSVLFKVKTDKDYSADNFQINVTKIEVKGVHGKGSFNQGLEDTDGSLTKSKTEHAGWTPDATAALCDYVAFEGDQVLTTTAVVTENVVSGNFVNNTNLILLPQELPADAALYVEYTIYNNNTGVTIPQNATVKLDAYGSVSHWLRGNRYKYTLTIGLDKIYFDPTVAEWVSVDAGDVTIGK